MGIQELKDKLFQVIRDLPSDADGWIPLTSMGTPLLQAQIPYKQYGKLKPFLENFGEILELKTDNNKTPPVCYVRLKNNNIFSSDMLDKGVSACQTQNSKENSPRFNQWAFVYNGKYKQLAKMALPEKWYYGEQQLEDDDPRKSFPILYSYLKYTFTRLYYENKICYAKDQKDGKEYAAFNTGLVDHKYEYIYALFTKNTFNKDTGKNVPEWYLNAFCVPGEDSGKTLLSLFNPFPKRTDYFENKIQNMLYDKSTGELKVDYKHIIVEHTERLPIEFLKDNCSKDFLIINGTGIDDVDSVSEEEYFKLLGEKIYCSEQIFNRLKNRIDDAISLAEKRVEWNYKTAIPMYFPTQNTGSLLLPLSLVDIQRVDLALVVERQQSGAYQGQTVLPLDLAYSNSRLITRPDSDWLKTELISNSKNNSLDDSE